MFCFGSDTLIASKRHFSHALWKVTMYTLSISVQICDNGQSFCLQLSSSRSCSVLGVDLSASLGIWLPEKRLFLDSIVIYLTVNCRY
jgi:hypothetical protein